MKHYLLNHQPQKGLQAACAQQGQAPTCNARGKGHTSASPKTLTKVILVLLTMFLLPSAAWGVEVIKTITFNKQVGPVDGTNIDRSAIPVSVSEKIGGTPYSYNSNVFILDDGAIEQYSSSSQGAVFKVWDDATSNMNAIQIIIPGNYPTVPTMVKLKFEYANAIPNTAVPDDDYNAIIYVCDYTSGDTPDLRYKTTESNLDKTTDPLIFTAEGKSVTVKGETIRGEGGTDRKDGPKSLWITAYLDGNPNPVAEEDRTTFTITEVEITYDINESDVYGLTVAGVPVTKVNKSAVFFDKDITDWDENKEKYTGTVSFTPAEATLTLSNANLKITTDGGAAIESSLSNLVVNLVGENNTITSTATTSYAFKGNGSNNTITFQTDDVQNPGKIQGNIPKANVFNNNITPSYQGLDLAGDNNEFTIGVIEYGLTIGETAVTSLNAKNILGDGKVSFTPAVASTSTPARLTLNGATISNIVSNLEGNLDILISGKNQLNLISSTGNTVKLHITTIENLSDVTSLSLVAPNGETSSVIKGFRDFTTDLTSYSVNSEDGSPASPITVTYDTNGYALKTENANTNAVVFSNITYYGITIGDVAVTSANLNTGTGAISGLNNVFFSPAGYDGQLVVPATLTLNGATIKGKIEWNSSGNLTIALNGKNTITSEKGGELFKSENTCTLNIVKADNPESATLKYASYSKSDDKIANATTYFSNFSPITPSSDFKTPFTVQVDGINYNYYTTAEVYPVTVAGRQVHNIDGEPGYRENILGDGKVSFTPATIGADQSSIPATLTLNGASIGQIKMTAAGDLTLHFVGENTITVENTNDYAIQGPGTTGTLEFSTSNGKTDILTIKGIAESKYFAGGWYSIPRLTTNSAAYDWVVISETTGNIHHISKNNKYDLWLNETRFCDATLSYDSGIAFNPETSTLTYAYTDPDHVIYSGLASLTIKMGNSQLKAIVFGSPDTEQPITATSGTLSIVKYSEGSSENCEFSLEGDGTNSVIRGFTSVDFGDFVVLSDGAKYNNGQLVDASGVAMTTATLSTNPVLPKPEMYSESSDETIQLGLTISNSTVSYGTLKYSIVYADNSEGVTDAVYEDDTPPTINKPATVTAWLQLNDMKSEVATGKYFGAKQKVFGMAIGDKIEGTSWFTPEITTEDQISSEFRLQEVDESGVFEIKQEGNDSYLVAKKSGTTTVNASLWSEEGITVLNSGIALKFNVGEELNSVFEGENTFGGLYNDSDTPYALPEKMTAYLITGISEDGTSVSTQSIDYLPARTAVLLQRGDGAKAITKIPYEGSATAPTNNKLNYSNPNTPAQPSATDKWYVIYNNKFVKVTTGTPVRGGKCYLNLNGTSSAGTRGFYDIDGSDGTTAIKDVKSGEVDGEKWADDGWHDLQGRRLSAKPTKPGLYILNGKKVVIK